MPVISSECPDCENYIDVDVDVHDFFESCDETEINDLVEALIDNGDIKPTDRLEKLNASESFYEEALDKLHGKWNRLSKEEEQIIILLSNKF